MAKILVTGASGLLGTEFCTQLKDADNYVWAIDNHSRSSTIPPCDVWVSQDLNDPRTFETLPTDFDYIYHYGAINGTTNFYKYPNKVLTNNFICDINVFNFASQCEKLKNLVYASSSEIVADDPASPVPENADVLIKNIHNPRWSYRLAKITSENFLTNSNLPWLILRYFNVYGKNSKQGHFLGDQINKIQNGTFSVIGANETRSFCYVSDAISASIHVAQTVSKEVINIGNDAEVRIGDAVKIIAKHLGYPDAVFEELPSVQGSVANRRPDISKLRKYMPSYNPISFDEGVEKIV
jgi:nucleoside-diphosphate-sugar epimerase